VEKITKPAWDRMPAKMKPAWDRMPAQMMSQAKGDANIFT
jgi:hypothetical protein